jgi:hypothetical protein
MKTSNEELPSFRVTSGRHPESARYRQARQEHGTVENWVLISDIGVAVTL